MLRGSNPRQGWNSCDSGVRQLVEKVSTSSKVVLGDNLISVILHGSLAMGSYYFPKSDVDVLVVVEKQLSPELRKRFFLAIAEISENRPTVGDVELSVVTKKALASEADAVPYEVHYSEEIKNAIEQFDFAKERTDYDLPAHFMVAYHKGIALFGPKFSDLTKEPSWDLYRDAVRGDLEWILAEENILSTPFYSILNCCRAYFLLVKKENSVLSKEEGAARAMDQFPQVRSTIERALAAYRSSKQVSATDRRHNGEEWDKDLLLSFRDEMRGIYRKAEIRLKG